MENNRSEMSDNSDNSDSPISPTPYETKRENIVELTFQALWWAVSLTVIYFLIDIFYFKHDLDDVIIHLGTLEPLFILLSFAIIEVKDWLISKFKILISRVKDIIMLQKVKRQQVEAELERKERKRKEMMIIAKSLENLPQDSELPQDKSDIDENIDNKQKN